MRDISIKARLITIFLLTGIGVLGAIIGGQPGYILAFFGIFGLIIMGIYTIIIFRQEYAEIKKRRKEYELI